MSILVLVALASGVADAQTCTSSRPKIVGGHAARIADWPGQVGLRLASEAGGVAFYFCGGTVIGDRWVLTAAHCFHDFIDRVAAPVRHSSGAVHDGRLEVVVGVEDLTRVPAERVVPVESVVVHEAYLGAVRKAEVEPDPEQRARSLEAIASTVGNDIALVRLARPWPGPYARLSLDAATDPRSPPGAQLRVAGYGRTEHNLTQPTLDRFLTADGLGELHAGSSRLLETAIELVDEARCRARYGGLLIGPGQVCAGLEQGGRDSCQADSGGPLVASGSDGCPYQVGLVSWGVGCAGEKAYGVYTRLSQHADWIQKHTGALRGLAAADLQRRPRGLTRAEADEALRQLADTLTGTRGVAIGVRGGNRVQLGAEVVFEIRSEIAGRLVVLDINADGEVLLVFPNRYVVDPLVGRVAAGQTLTVPGPGYGFRAFRAAEPLGEGRLVALVAPEGFDIERFAAGAEQRTKGFQPVEEPASYLMRLVRQIELTLGARTRTGTAAPAPAPADGWAWGNVRYVIER